MATSVGEGKFEFKLCFIIDLVSHSACGWGVIHIYIYIYIYIYIHIHTHTQKIVQDRSAKDEDKPSLW